MDDTLLLNWFFHFTNYEKLKIIGPSLIHDKLIEYCKKGKKPPK